LPALVDALETRLTFGKFEGLTLADVWSLCKTAAQWKAAKKELPDRVPAVFSLLG